MNARRIAGLFGGAAAAALAVGAEVAKAQENSGGQINLGGSISNTVTGAVSGIATNSGGGTVTGGTRVENNVMQLGDKEGVAISDASGGNHNVSFVS